MGPGLFSDIGKRARDLLYTEYSTDQKLSLLAKSGGKLLASKQQNVLGEIHSHIKYNNSLCDIRMKSDSTPLVATFTLNQVMPVFRSIFSVSDQKTGKAEIQYAHKYIGLSATTGLTTIPVAVNHNHNVASLGMSAVFGTAAMSVGADMGYDTVSNDVTNYIAASICISECIASLTLRNREDLVATCFRLVSPTTAVAAELFHHFPSHTNTAVFGVQHAIHPDTTVKARINTSGTATVMFQHFWPHALISVTAETNLLANDSSGRVGLDLTLRA